MSYLFHEGNVLLEHLDVTQLGVEHILEEITRVHTNLEAIVEATPELNRLRCHRDGQDIVVLLVQWISIFRPMLVHVRPQRVASFR